jgi:hypothetical protein
LIAIVRLAAGTNENAVVLRHGRCLRQCYFPTAAAATRKV